MTASLIVVAAMASEAVLLGTAECLEKTARGLRAAHEVNPAVKAFRRYRAAQVDRAARAPGHPDDAEAGQ